MARSFRFSEDTDTAPRHARASDYRAARKLTRRCKDGELDREEIEGLRARLGAPNQ